MFRTSRLLLALVTASAAVLLAPTAASADEPEIPSGPVVDCLTGLLDGGLVEGDLAECLPPAPELPAPAADVPGSPVPAPLDALPLPVDAPQADEVPTTEAEQPGDVPAAEAPNPAAALCEQLESGLGALPLPAELSAPLADLLGQFCTAGAELPATLEDLLDKLVALLPALPELPELPFCLPLGEVVAILDSLGLAAVLDQLPAQLQELLDAVVCDVPEPTPAPTPEPQPAAQPVVHPQPAQQHEQPAVVPVAHTGGTGGGGQLAYTGAEPAPYLAGGLIALGLGTGLTLLGRRRVESDA